MSPRTRPKEIEFRTAKQRLSRINSVKRKLGERPMDAAFREYRKSHPRAKFEQFETLVAALAGSNRSHGEISKVTGIRRGNIPEAEGMYELRNEAEKERVNFESMGRRRKLEHQPGGMEKVVRILGLMRPESGMSESAICKQEGIDVSTLQRLRRDYPDVRPEESHHSLRAQAISDAKTELPEERILELLKKRVVRNGRVEHAHSIGRIHEILEDEWHDFTLSAVAHFAGKHKGGIGRTKKINTHLGKLHQQGKLYDNTRPYEPREPGIPRMKIPKPEVM